jgi:hypothetical protein
VRPVSARPRLRHAPVVCRRAAASFPCGPAVRRKAAAIAATALLAAAACGRGEEEARQPTPGGAPFYAARQAPAPQDDDAIVQVIAEDRIAAVDEPVFVPAPEAAGFMGADEPVVGLEVDGEARAYSLWFLDRHEIVNDRSGDVPLVVSWCPLAGSARAYERRAGGRELTFGVSGRLWRNALVMRDRQSGTLWSQVSGAALEGPLQGAELRPLPASVTPWSEWLRLHPGTRVLRKPPLPGTLYPDYVSDPERVGYYGQKRIDPRLPPKERVLGVEVGGSALAVPLRALRGRPVWNERVGKDPVLLVSLGERGPEAAYSRRVGARDLTFDAGPGEGEARDRETGSIWSVASGVARSGALAGSRLQRLDAQGVYWFVWSAFHRGGEVRDAPAGGAPAPGDGGAPSNGIN